MKIVSIISGLALTGFCLITPSVVSAEDQTGGPHPGTMWHQHEVSAQVPTEGNRASKIIGMDIVNAQDQKLGVVRDLAIDPKSQRVAYAWVEKSDETADTGKYVAVPINYLTPSVDQKNFVLNADKSRFDSARGYAKNQMPNMALDRNQVAFWQSIVEAAGAQSPSK